MSGERGISTVGRAPALQVGSQEFESPILHLRIANAPLALWRKHRTHNSAKVGSIPTRST